MGIACVLIQVQSHVLAADDLKYAYNKRPISGRSLDTAGEDPNIEMICDPHLLGCILF